MLQILTVGKLPKTNIWTAWIIKIGAMFKKTNVNRVFMGTHQKIPKSDLYKPFIRTFYTQMVLK